MSRKHLAIVTDLALDDWIGGGTLVNAYVAGCAREHGWQVSYIRINPRVDEWKTFAHGEVDAYFVANIPHMPVAYMLELVNSGKRYVMFRHDIASICYEAEPANNPAATLVRFLFENAAANFFISSLQLAYYQRVCAIPRHAVIPPPLDLSRFRNEERADRAGHLYLGEISSARGVDESLRQMAGAADGGPMALYGQITEPAMGELLAASGASHHEAVAHAEVPALLNRFRHFHYHPRIIDAFCLKVLEAELCGMTLHVNRANIGRFHYGESAEVLAAFMKNDSAPMILRVLS